MQTDWHLWVIGIGGAWSVFWSFAPTPKPNTWYNAIFHTAQYLSLNPGRSIAVAMRQALLKRCNSSISKG